MLRNGLGTFLAYYNLSDPVRVKQAMVKVDGDATPPFFGLGGFQIIILMSFVSKIFF